MDAEADVLIGLEGGTKRAASVEVSAHSTAASRIAALRRRVAMRSAAAATGSQGMLCNRVAVAHAAEGPLCTHGGASRHAYAATHFVRA